MIKYIIISLIIIQNVMLFDNKTINYQKPFSIQMKNNFINFINNASIFYKKDVKVNLIYIQQNMEKIYGEKDYKFFIFIQTRQTITNRVTYDNSFYIEQLQGINKLYPQWSYYISYLRLIADFTFTYMDNGIIGYVQSAIKLNEKMDNLHVNKQFTKNYFQVICDNNGLTYGYTGVLDQLYGTFKPRNCWYTIYFNRQIYRYQQKQ